MHCQSSHSKYMLNQFVLELQNRIANFVSSARCELVNKALLDHFLTTCAIQTHFIAIKKFLLLEDGEFAHVLSNGLCEELTYGSSPLYLCSSSFLNPLLHLSLESCLHGHTPQAQRLAFRLKHRPSIIHSQGKNYIYITDQLS